MLWHNSWAKSALFKGFCTIINHCYYCYLGLTATRFSNDFAGSLVDSVHGGDGEYQGKIYFVLPIFVMLFSFLATKCLAVFAMFSGFFRSVQSYDHYWHTTLPRASSFGSIVIVLKGYTIHFCWGQWFRIRFRALWFLDSPSYQLISISITDNRSWKGVCFITFCSADEAPMQVPHSNRITKC